MLIIGLYFIAEHGIMNWLVSYATNALEVPMGQAANFTAVFFGCVMVGRLVLSSLVDKLGIYRCLRLFATSAAVLYTGRCSAGCTGSVAPGSQRSAVLHPVSDPCHADPAILA